ncbi:MULTISPECIES: MarR family transcriptional regulator [unclassified Streptomyces]|uniref:MarR family winged helix-turn-helix transcriptional regulator n=1 Tax=unclassified Streptomyces TaxID=2593676 RepID=UPI002DD993EC|nr:MarR family transcriptional regulator [Streptomyces sp. NBC_01750]WSA99244.1 MarR family transcriptional regulator [Streptomyces sp. NBC_01794]WSD36190.1 MarR family transcriptional regulator [Streptomyces sp. NBC_01750]
MGANRTGSTVLDDQLCFALYSASRAVTAAYRPVLAELELTYPQYLVMLAVWERGEVPMKELGAALGLDYGTLSPLLKRLESAGLLRRERQPEDERLVMVAATERGEALRERAEQVPTAMGRRYGLTADEAGRLRDQLRDLVDRLS